MQSVNSVQIHAPTQSSLGSWRTVEPTLQGVARTLDIVIAGVLLIPALLVMLAAAIAVKATSRGPVLYRCDRHAYGGGRFQMLKIRTMVDADRQVEIMAAEPAARRRLGRDFKLVDDPRVTPVGRILRRTSVDELPQLFNVLRGDMSIVGPRPKLVAEGHRYGDLLPTVLSVRPGITGSWQTSGRNELTFEERIRLDVEYVRGRNLRWDVKICLKTVAQLLSRHRHGAY